MRFWDSSAIVPLLVEQAQSPKMVGLVKSDPSIAVWWSTVVECSGAIARLERGGRLTEQEVAEAFAKLDRLAGGWSEATPSLLVKQTARRLLRTHPLRAADSLQLAAALAVSEPTPFALDFVCLDDRLTTAARKEGLRVFGGEAVAGLTDSIGRGKSRG